MRPDNETYQKKIEACRELFMKYDGKHHRRIESEMRALGYKDFSRRCLYSRYERGKKSPGWIEKYFEQSSDIKRSPDIHVRMDATASNINPSTHSPQSTQKAHCVSSPHVSKGSTRGCKTQSNQTLLQKPARSKGTLGTHASNGNTRPPHHQICFKSWLKRISPKKMTWDARHQQYIFQQLHRVTTGDCKRLMIFMPPRHGKSEMVTVRYSAWRIKQDPKLNIILGSYNQHLANRFSRMTRNVLYDDQWIDSVNSEQRTTNSEKTKNSSPVSTNSKNSTNSTNSPKDSKNYLRLRHRNSESEWETPEGGGIRAVGGGAGVTGYGASLIIVDDPVKSREQAESATYREKVWDWFNDDLYTRLEPEGAMILIQTRWHEDDLAGRLIKEMNADPEAEQWDIIDLPAIAEESCQSPVVSRQPGDARVSSPHVSKGSTCGCKTQSNQTLLQKPARSKGTFDQETDQRPTDGHDHQLQKPAREQGRYTTVGAGPRSSSPTGTNNIAQGKADGRHPGIGRPYSSDPEGVEHRRDVAPLQGAAQCRNNIPGVPLEAVAHPRLLSVSPSATGTGGPLAHTGTSSCPLGRQPGDALWPERFSVEKLNAIKKKLGTYSFAALYQQKPVPAEGGLFKRGWFKIVPAAPPGLKWKRGWDFAISSNQHADYTATAKVGYDPEGNLYIDGVQRIRAEYPDQRKLVVRHLQSEPSIQQGIELAANGHAVLQDLRRDARHRGHLLRGVKVDGNKISRALSWIALAEEGRVKLVRGHWNNEFIEEACSFPLGTHDDQIDAVSIGVQMHLKMPGRFYVF